MKIFITVGSTQFTELIKECDKLLSSVENEITAQIGHSPYIPKSFPSFRFTSEIDSYYNNAEVIICHAGAGTVYSLLEKGKRIIVVPNLNLADDHQKEIANFVLKNNYAAVCLDPKDINKHLTKTTTPSFAPYNNSNSSLVKSIASIIK